MHRNRKFLVPIMLASGMFLAACGGAADNAAEPASVGATTTESAAAEGDTAGTKYKVALSLSYTGNDWQDQAANLVKGAAASEPYASKVELVTDISGPDVTKQIQLLNNQIASGVDAIIVYPISPTALNETIKKACDQGIVVVAYDSLVTEPCAYNVHIDQYEHARYTSEWLVKELNGKGTIANITGVPGTTVDSDRQKALDDVLAANPGVTIAGSANGDWAQQVGTQALQQIMAAHPDIDGIFAQAGCWSMTSWQIKQGNDPLPCAGEFGNGHHIYMLPKEQGGIGLRSSSAGSPVYSGELAFINAVRVLDGEQVARNMILPIPRFTSEDVIAAGNQACNNNPAEGGLMMCPGAVPGGFFDGFWSPLVTQGLQAALTGEPDKISDPLPCSQVKGCIERDKLTFDDNHVGGN